MKHAARKQKPIVCISLSDDIEIERVDVPCRTSAPA